MAVLQALREACLIKQKPTQYLVRFDYPNRKNPSVVLRGSAEEIQKLIDSLVTKWKFSAGVLSWHSQDNVSKEQEDYGQF